MRVQNILFSMPAVRIGLLACILLTGLVGCNGQRPKLRTFEAQYSYWNYMKKVKQDPEAEDALNETRINLVKNKFKSIRQSPMPMTLPGMRIYVNRLKEPIIWSPEAVLKNENMNMYLRRDIIQWYGSDVLKVGDLESLYPTWTQEIIAANSHMQTLEARIQQYLDDAKTAVDQKRFEDADKLIKKAIEIDAQASNLAATHAQMQRKWVRSKWADLVQKTKQTDLPKLDEQVGKFQNEQTSTYELTKQVQSGVDRIRKEYQAFEKWTHSRADFQNEFSDMRSMYDQQMNSYESYRGKAWAEHLWLITNDQKYWQLYEQLQDYIATMRDGNNVGYTSEEVATLRKHLQDGYVQCLPRAINHYSNLANKSRTQRANGLALIYWRIALELIDYAKTIDCQLPMSLVDMIGALDRSMAISRSRVLDDFERYVFIPECGSQLRDSEDFAKLLTVSIQDALTSKLSGQNQSNTCYGAVVKQESTDKQRPNDYQLDGIVYYINVDTIPPYESERKEVQIGRDIKRMTNEDYRTNTQHPWKYEQEVWVYEKITTKHTKKCSIRAKFDIKHDDKQQELWKIRETYGDGNPLAGCTLVDDAVEWSFAVIRKHESPRKGDMITGTELPKNSAARLSLDRDVEHAAADMISMKIASQIVAMVEQYPFTDLVEKSSLAQRKAQHLEAADLQGRLLEYLMQLTIANQENFTASGHDWIQLRQQMVQDIQSKCLPGWASHGVTATDDVLKIWDTAVQLAHQVELQ